MMLIRKMKPAGAVVLVAAAAVALSGCASSGSAEANGNVEKACGVEISENSGKATFDRQRPKEQITGDELYAWQRFASAASSAAAEDPAHAELEDAATTVYLKKKKYVENKALFSEADVAAHNEALEMWRLKCNALVDRLNS